jgi:hypothetical protein
LNVIPFLFSRENATLPAVILSSMKHQPYRPMKRSLLLILFACSGFLLSAQCPVQIQHTNVLCNGQCNGTAQAFGTGNAPFLYSWLPGGQTTQSVSGLCAGTYTVYVVNSVNCVGNASVTITQPPQLFCAGTGNNNTSCTNCNGSVIVTATGGTPGYTYSWAPGGATNTVVTGLCGGVYTCTVTDANGCSSQTFVTITNQQNPPTLTTNSQNPTCSNCNGIVNAAASGGQSPYSYLWSPSGCTSQNCTGLCAGTYTCTVTDANGCTATATQTLTAGGNLQVVTTGQSPNSCTNCNGIVVVSASGGNGPYTYSWAPGGCTTTTCTGLCSGVYTCYVTDANGCTGQSSWTLTAPGAPQFTTSATPATQPNCTNGSATVNLSQPGTYTFAWTPSGQTTQTATGLQQGVYTVCVTNTQNSCSMCQVVTVSCLTGIETLSSGTTLGIYPNPASGSVMIEYSGEAAGEMALQIMNMLGEVMYDQQVHASKQFSKQVDISAYPKRIIPRVHTFG